MTAFDFLSPSQGDRFLSLLRRLFLLSLIVSSCLILNTVRAGAQTSDDHGDFLSTATPLSLGSSLAGRIDPGSDRDFFELDLSSASAQSDLWIYTTGELDTIGWLFDAAYEEQAEDDNLTSGVNDNFHLRAIVPSGVYYVEVRSSGDETGDYTIHAEVVAHVGSTTGTATSLNLDSPVAGTIDASEDSDYFEFSLTDSMNLALRGVSGNGDPIHGSIVDNTGTEIEVNVRPGFGIEDDFGPGTYFLRVNTPVDVTSHPVPYIIHAYEDTEYTNFLDDCEDKTGALNNLQITDPLYGCQWHLKNSADEDINVEVVWAEGIDGNGVNVAIVDDGMDHGHEDLVDNVDASRNHDYTGGDDLHQPLEHHGTNVAGIIAASANSVGVRGVAPQATVYGYNYLVDQTDLGRADSMTRDRAVTAVSNNSWGPRGGPGLGQADSLWELAIESGVSGGLNGKGIFYTFAGGNHHRYGDNSNLNELANYHAVTAVCAVNDGDTRASYSEMGANLWVCAPSGDRSAERRGILTTENSDRYHVDFSGTSAATPIVSGVAALMRQANPSLTWRDLKLILAASARKNDPASSNWVNGAQKYGSDSASDRYHFNHEYGFGMVDAGAAVAMAKAWNDTLPPLQSETVESSDSSERILDAPAVGTPTPVSQSLTMVTGIDFIEFVEVNASFQHNSFRDLEIVLVSPSGAESTLTVPFDTFNDDDPEVDFIPLRGSFRFGSARHLGEDPNGKWTLRITDNFQFGGGTLESWGITVYGHGPTPGVPAVNSATPGAGSLTVAWTAPDQALGAPVTSYDLRYIQRNVGDLSDVNWLVLENVWNATSGGSLEYTVSRLVGGAQHLLQLRAVSNNTVGSWSASVSATPDRIFTNACTSGSAVSNPSANAELVADCNALLAARDVLAGDATLNWSARTPIRNWDGVTVEGTPLRVTELDLYDSDLTGAIPMNLRDLDRLKVLSLGKNNLAGPIPSWLSEIDNLRVLLLWGNRLAGEIPSELRLLHNLQVLSISGKQLTGVMPDWLGDLDNLVRLYVYDTQLSGSIPSSLGNPLRLERLSLWGNELTGPVPTWLGSLTNLDMLSLYNNQLTGEIPSEIGSLTRLQRLYLHQNQLSGTIPTEIGGLSNLRQLYLWGNELTGTIPAELGGLANIEIIAASNNQFTGPIPTQLGSLTKLTQLRLSGNQLSGPIPPELGNLSNLTSLWLSENQLSGSIPAGLGNLSSLTAIVLWGNELTGKIPTQLGNLPNLTLLSLTSNQLSGNIPAELGKLSNLMRLYLSNNQFTGCIPGSLRSVEQNDLDRVGLKYCDVVLSDLTVNPGSLTPAFDPYLNNYYVGGVTAPRVTVAATSDFNAILQFLDEDYDVQPDASDSEPGHQVSLGNGFTTVRVRSVSQDSRAANTYTILVSRTPLTSNTCATGTAVASPANSLGLVSDCDALLSIRDSLAGNATLNWSANIPVGDWDGVTVSGRTPRVTRLNLGDHQLTGTIPAALSKLENLEWISLAQNKLTGSIPAELGSLAKLRQLYLWDNQLSGTIPNSLNKLTNLERLTLSDNELTGAIPSSLGNFSNLQSLRLHGNQLTGTIPSQLGMLSSLRYLSLSDNQLTGSVPSELGNLASMESLYLWGNNLSGSIPASIGNLTRLEALSLSRNQLTGTIPTSLGDLVNLKQLYLWDNQITGSIPEWLGDLSNLEELSLSHNQLTGSIPASLTRLVNLESLFLRDNQLTGCIPAGLRGVPDNDLNRLGLLFCSVQAPDKPSVSMTTTSTTVRFNSPVPVTATFAEPVYGFTVGDVSVANGSASNFVGTDGDTVYTFDVSVDTVGIVTVDITADVAADTDGNGNIAAVQLSLGLPYDDDNDGRISRDEVVTAIGDYLFSGALSRDQMVALIGLYLFG